MLWVAGGNPRSPAVSDNPDHPRQRLMCEMYDNKLKSSVHDPLMLGLIPIFLF